MASKGSPMLQPISLIFRYLQNSTRVSIWLYDNGEERMEGIIIGFDEFMNLTLDATTLHSITNPTNSKEELGRILLKGDNITLIRAVEKE